MHCVRLARTSVGMPVPETNDLPKQAALVVNARSRKGRDLFFQAEEKLEASGIEIIAARAVRDPRKLRDHVREVLDMGAPMVIVGGGDGTLSCAVDDFVSHKAVFAFLPLGT